MRPSTVTDPGVWLDYEDGIRLASWSQLNSAMAVRISDSNLNDFSDAGVFVHPMSANALVRTVSATGASAPARGTLEGEGVTLYMYNDTISNTPQGVHVNSESVDDSSGESPMQLVLLNNTFYNDPFAIQTIAPQFNGHELACPTSSRWRWTTSSTGRRASRSTSRARRAMSTLEYNLFFNNTHQPRRHDHRRRLPGQRRRRLRQPRVRRRGDRELRAPADSAAIDAARSEIGPIPGADAIYPTVDQLLSDAVRHPDRPDHGSPSGTARGFQRLLAASATSRIRARSSPCRDRETSASRTNGFRR